jgi:hypothetical protein
MDPLDIIARPNSYKEPVIVETNGKLRSHDVIVYQEPNVWDFQADKDGWSTCCKAIFTKFEETGKSSSSIGLSCPESHRVGEEGLDSKALAEEALNSAYSYASENPNVNIHFVAKNDNIRDVYINVMKDTAKLFKEIYGDTVVNRVVLNTGQIAKSEIEVIAITIDELPEVKSASVDYVDYIKRYSEYNAQIEAQIEAQRSETRVAKFEERESKKPKAEEGKGQWFDYKPPEGEKAGKVSELKTGTKEQLHKDFDADDGNEVRFHVDDDIEGR